MVGLTDVFGSVADFGAEQVILVRDDIMKEKVQGEIGEVALVLSILDSKGMEFDDVFLLDFFSSSPTPSGLRGLKDILISGSNKTEIERNALLCSELKV
jgi:superfamily I DNA/RNA helicase